MSHTPGQIRFTVLAGGVGAGRRCRFVTAHGVVETPTFMPVGSDGAVRTLTPAQVVAAGGPAVVLGNTFRLLLAPGPEVVAQHGGLHRFMGWERSILTDSGGFQIFSLPGAAVTDSGIRFPDPRKEHAGREVWLDPEESLRIQGLLGSDIAMALDECPGYPATHAQVAAAVARTSAWAARCCFAHARPGQLLFGIVQGGTFADLRRRSIAEITGLPFDGFAIGGVSVGEGSELIHQVVAETAPQLPVDRPRYLMGVGLPEDILTAVAAGCDLFDCVIPTRYGRNATLFTRRGKVRIQERRYRRDLAPVDAECGCYTCRTFTRSYLHHLFAVAEPLGATLASLHNLCFYQELMAGIRAAIEADRLQDFSARFLDRYLRGSGRPTGESAAPGSMPVAAAERPTPGHVKGKNPAPGRGRRGGRG